MKVEDYYHRAATKAGRIVYVSEMLLGNVAAAAIAGLIIAPIVLLLGSFQTEKLQVLPPSRSCATARARSGARQRARAHGLRTGQLQHRLRGRPPSARAPRRFPALRRRHLRRSRVLPHRQRPPDHRAAERRLRSDFYGILAFFAGFSERFTNVIFGSAQRMVAGREEPTGPETTRPPETALPSRRASPRAAADARRPRGGSRRRRRSARGRDGRCGASRGPDHGSARA